MKQLFLVLFTSFFFSAASANAVIVHERNFKAANVIIHKIETYSDFIGMQSMDSSTYVSSNKESLPQIVIAVGLKVFRAVCNAPSDKTIVAIFLGREEYLSVRDRCLSPSTAVFSGANLALRLRVLKYILPNVNRLGLVFSQNLKLDEKYFQEQASLHELSFVFSPTSNDRASIIKAMNNTVADTDAMFSLIDSELYLPQIIQDVLKLCFRQRKIMVGPSNNFVKAGALFSIYSDAEEQIRSLANLLVHLNAYPMGTVAPFYPPNLKIVFNPYLVRSFGLVLPSAKYLENAFGLCPELGCAKTLD
ncbi:hypothetical protein [Marinomonas algicola]|uniref:hypothetical protein n=1 Tax=Marinomonas algicola TaxID=2773454 RepID=UPI0017493763|nr:hypothetical protein [Marinomonas algicola]